MSDNVVQDSLAATAVTVEQIMNAIRRTDQKDPDSVLTNTLALRFKMVEVLMASPALMVADAKLTGNIRGLLDSIDKQTLTVQKQKNDKEAAEISNDNILAAFAALSAANGRNLIIGGQPVLATPVDIDSVDLPVDEFTFTDSEVIVGNDTENSLL